MTSSLSLHGKRVLITREEQQAEKMKQLVISNGGIPIVVPLLSFRAVSMTSELQMVIQKLHTYDWLVFTSQNAVAIFLQLVNLQSVSRLPKIAAVGEKTKQFLVEKGFDVEFVPSKFVAETFVAEFLPMLHKGAKVLLPKGNLARDVIAPALRQADVLIDDITIYETCMPEGSRQMLASLLNNKEIDIVTFTSPSTVEHFMKIVREEDLTARISDCVVACIGPIARKKAETLGLTVHVEPEVYTVEEMINSLMKYITNYELNHHL